MKQKKKHCSVTPTVVIYMSLYTTLYRVITRYKHARARTNLTPKPWETGNVPTTKSSDTIYYIIIYIEAQSRGGYYFVLLYI